MKEFFLDIMDLKAIWLGFIKVDTDNKGSIGIQNLLDIMQERQYSVIAPFLERFFFLIEKIDPNKCDFEEFLPNLCVFNLFTK